MGENCDIFGRGFYSYRNLDKHFAKYTNGNRKEKGIRISHFNQGGALLHNKINMVEAFIEHHQPHLLGISESNYLKSKIEMMFKLRIIHLLRQKL